MGFYVIAIDSAPYQVARAWDGQGLMREVERTEMKYVSVQEDGVGPVSKYYITADSASDLSVGDEVTDPSNLSPPPPPP